ncbi:MAG: FAD-dependent oxidoreductase [Candidatus Sumerlaea chitinivorans]|nr:FAD-dependent oxidoreductase [Candidatus Sumerlaea chitinivorans]
MTTSASVLSYDVVIVGGSFSAPAAALAAARTNPSAKILLVEPTDWLGGQTTAQGVAAIDNAWHNPGATLMRNNPTLYYPADYLDFLNRLKTAPPEAPGEGFAPNGSAWVTREAFDPRTAVWALDNMMAEYTSITVMRMTVVKSVTTTTVIDSLGTALKITSLTLIQRSPINGYVPHTKFTSQEIMDWYDPNPSSDFAKSIYSVVPRDPTKGLVVIDASETGDVIVLSGALYTVGREKTTEELGEDGSLPLCDEHGSQATVFPFCMTDNPTTHTEDELKTPWPDFDSYYATQSATYFSFGSYTYNRIWTYRRLKNTGPLFNFDSVNLGDVSMQNWYPGNDYPYGSIYKSKAECSAEASDWRGGLNLTHLAQAEKHAVAWYFYMKERRTTSWDTRMPRGSDPMNMMATGHGLAKFPYIRCCRRIIGLNNFRLTSRYFVNTLASDYNGGTSWRFYDSVGIGNYAVDIHPTKNSTGISPPFTYAAPFYIPYRALGSANVRNLLAGGKQIATTYITNAAYRLHPIEWAIGSAVGTAAAMMAKDGLSNTDLLDTPTLRQLQATVRTNSPIHWAAFDSDPFPPNNGDLVVNDCKPVQSGVPFRVEVYHHRAKRARVFNGAEFLGETTTRANGRLLLSGVSVTTTSQYFVAYCYDDAGQLLDILTVGTPRDLSIIDDTDPEFTLTGTWTFGTAQPNKYKTSYRYSWGSNPPSTATWKLYIPTPGIYEIFIWYPQASNRATDAPFTIYHAGGQTTVLVNQQLNGGVWLSLGQFQFRADGSAKLVLSNAISDPSKLVVADAARAVFVSSSVTNWEEY